MILKETTFKKGEHVCFAWGVKDIFEIKLKPRFKGRIEYITIELDGKRREMLAQNFRHAVPAEVIKNQRINDVVDLKQLGGATALIKFFGVKALQKAVEDNSENIAFEWNGIDFTRAEAVEALEAHKSELVEGEK